MRFRYLTCGIALTAALATAPIVSSYADIDPLPTEVGSCSLQIPLEVAPSQQRPVPYGLLLPEWFAPVMPAQLNITPEEQGSVTTEAKAKDEVDEETVVKVTARLDNAASTPAAAPTPPAAAAKKSTAAKPKVIDRKPLNRQQRLTRTALTYRGVAYTWGGESRKRGFDCSGLTQHLYRKEGVELPHSAKLQYKMGKPVELKNLKHGDLLFFNTMGPLTHVGLYIGDGKFVHAANSRRGIVVNSLAESYYRKTYEGARRYLP